MYSTRRIVGNEASHIACMCLLKFFHFRTIIWKTETRIYTFNSWVYSVMALLDFWKSISVKFIQFFIATWSMPMFILKLEYHGFGKMYGSIKNSVHASWFDHSKKVLFYLDLLICAHCHNDKLWLYCFLCKSSWLLQNMVKL